MTLHYKAWHNMARHVMTWHIMAWQGLALCPEPEVDPLPWLAEEHVNHPVDRPDTHLNTLE